MKKFFLLLKKIAKLRYYAIAFVVGLVFAIGGGMFTYSTIKSKTNWIKTDAVIDDIQSTQIDENNTEYNVTITYSDESGTSHTVVIHEYTTGWAKGKTISVQYDASNPENVGTPSGNIICYILLGIGIVVMIGSVVLIIKTVKTSTEDMDDLDKVDMSKVNQVEIDEIKNSTEEKKEYYFHFTGKLNQSFIMETPDRKPIFEAVNTKMGVVTKPQFEFINHLTGKKEEIEVTHTVTTSVDDETTSIPTDSHFKINGENCWDVLGKKGYSLDIHMEGVSMAFDVLKYKVKVAEAVTAGTNLLDDSKQHKVTGNIPTSGIYKISCRESDIEGVFLACFIFGRIR